MGISQPAVCQLGTSPVAHQEEVCALSIYLSRYSQMGNGDIINLNGNKIIFKRVNFIVNSQD